MTLPDWSQYEYDLPGNVRSMEQLAPRVSEELRRGVDTLAAGTVL
jgi:hypothetical protein